jgi:hypothetical protein
MACVTANGRLDVMWERKVNRWADRRLRAIKHGGANEDILQAVELSPDPREEKKDEEEEKKEE